ncbi:MAG: cell wall hydrolase [Hungatella sp.]|nr:cell wall hydrolase [Hungatella sp.]
MIKTHGNTRGIVYVLSVLAIIALTFSGFGGSGREGLTAFAETSSPEFLESARQGSLVVGYMMEKDARQKKDALKEQQESMKEGSYRAENHESLQANERTENHESSQAHERIGTYEKPETKGAEQELTNEDYQVLLKIVEAEAGVCDSKGKILVANVVLNRVRSKEFPDTIQEVVYQPSQFSPVSNGSINTCEVTSQTVDCVNRALAGEDYSQGALYFMNRGASKTGAVRWFDGRLTFLFSHQSHEFFK